MLSIFTGGLWLVSWAALCIGKTLRPWRCEHCGWHKPEFLDPGHKAKSTKSASLSKSAPASPLRTDHSPTMIPSRTGQLRA
jgi:hypothetical protein